MEDEHEEREDGDGVVAMIMDRMELKTPAYIDWGCFLCCRFLGFTSLLYDKSVLSTFDYFYFPVCSVCLSVFSLSAARIAVL